MEEIELRQYFEILRKWMWLIVLTTVIAGASAFLTSKHTTPVYQASSTLLINQARNPDVSYADIMTSERLAHTYAKLLISRPVLEETAKRLGLNGINQGDISVQPVRDTQLIVLKANSTIPSLAARIANTLPQVFIEQNNEMQSKRYAASKEGLQKEMQDIESQIKSVQAQIEALGNPADVAGQTKKTQLETLLAQYRSSYASLLNNYEAIRLAEARESTGIQISEPARIPGHPIKPRTMMNTLLAAIVGAMLGLGAAFMIEYLDDTLKTPFDVERYLGITVLTGIGKTKESRLEKALITADELKSPITESYRALRTNIQFSGVDKPIRTLSITSANPLEGKSTVTANLAVVMAQAGKKVIAVDADLRRPMLHKIFNLPNNRGLTNLLIQQDSNLNSYLQDVAVKGLSVITSGPIPPNPAELLGSRRMAELVHRLSKGADLVVFDTAPIMAATDTVVMAPVVDGTMLVLEAGKTRIPAARQSLESLNRVGGRVLGAVLNKLPRNGRSYYYYYYYYYTQDGEKKKKHRKQSRKRTFWQRLLKRA